MVAFPKAMKIQTRFFSLLLFVAAVFLGCNSDQPAPEELALQAAEHSVALLRNDQIHDLYLKADPRLKESITYPEFERYWDQYDIATQVEQVEYGTVEIRKGVANIAVRMLRKDYAIVPMTLRFARENSSDWNLVYITVNQLDYYRSLGMVDPSRLEMQNLVMDSTRELQLALRQNDFKPFYLETIARLWRSTVSEIELLQNFQPLGRSSFVQMDLREVSVNLHPSSGIRLDGVLHVQGEMISRPVVRFEYQYVWENMGFRPIGMNLGN